MRNTAAESAQSPVTGHGSLFVGGLAAILASACCLGPLVLMTAGVSGAWIGNLTALEPLRPLFVGTAVVALFLAYKQIFRPAAACKPGEVCAVPQVRAVYKALFGLVTILILIAIGFPFVLPLFY